MAYSIPFPMTRDGLVQRICSAKQGFSLGLACRQTRTAHTRRPPPARR